MLHQRSVRFAPDTRFDDDNDSVLTSDFAEVEDQNELGKGIGIGIGKGKRRKKRSPLLIEIISAADLVDSATAKANSNSSSSSAPPTISPYVSIFYGKNNNCVHSTTTATATTTLDPIWTIESESLFLFDPEEYGYGDVYGYGENDNNNNYYDNEDIEKQQQLVKNKDDDDDGDAGGQDGDGQQQQQLTFIVLNKAIKKATLRMIGQASISLSTLLETKEGERIELPLLRPSSSNGFHQTTNATTRRTSNGSYGSYGGYGNSNNTYAKNNSNRGNNQKEKEKEKEDDSSSSSESSSMTLSIRYRRATDNDIKFISDSSKAFSSSSSSSSSSSKADNTKISRNHSSMITPVIENISSFVRRRKVVNDTTYYLAIPPKPNPEYGGLGLDELEIGNNKNKHKHEREQWLTQNELDKTIWEPSTSWSVCYGKGSLGKLYIEVIECNDLLYRHQAKQKSQQRTATTTTTTTTASAAAAAAKEKKVDPFVTIIHEDSIVSTDALPDCKNPRFLPWSRRAFKFHIEHSYSPIFIGVYDYEEDRLNLGGLKKKLTGKHNKNISKKMKKKRKFEEIGRAAISIQKLKSNVQYNMVYDLYRSGETNPHQRIKQGSITLRITLQWYNERKVFFDIMNPHPTRFAVNVPTKVDYEDVNYAINGFVDMSQYDTTYIQDMVDELIEYHHYFHRLNQFCKGLFFWRPTYKIPLCCFDLKLPLDSIVIFTFANIIVEWPQYSVCIFFATVTWGMLALLELQRSRPSAWGKPPSYWELLFRLVLGISWSLGSSVPRDHNKDADEQHQESWNKHLRHNDQETRRWYEDLQKRWHDEEQMEKELNQMLNKQEIKSRFKLENIFKSVLYPLQLNLRELCLSMRFVDQIIRWEQLYICFWITTTTLVLTIIFAFLIFRYNAWLWFQRIVLWGFCGPCNYLIGLLYYRNSESMSGEGDDHHERKKSLTRKEQIMREDKIKAAAMRKFMFGNYGLEVPDLLRRPERYTPVPQISSSCSPCSIRQIDKLIEKSHLTESIIGQHNGISGQMVPLNYTDHLANDIRKYKSFVASGILTSSGIIEDQDTDTLDSETTPLLSS